MPKSAAEGVDYVDWGASVLKNACSVIYLLALYGVLPISQTVNDTLVTVFLTLSCYISLSWMLYYYAFEKGKLVVRTRPHPTFGLYTVLRGILLFLWQPVAFLAKSDVIAEFKALAVCIFINLIASSLANVTEGASTKRLLITVVFLSVMYSLWCVVCLHKRFGQPNVRVDAETIFWGPFASVLWAETYVEKVVDYIYEQTTSGNTQSSP